ncbi:hypothetical protein K501DRAFT_194901 [Backusella circina FSU 941]|nr:hypothetical protein K501DRAFT_194901 [Backusella circina FSU 941]
MNFKDLQFSIGKLTTDIRSQMARRNPLQSHDTKALNLWVFEERNDVASLKTCNYHHKETDKAFLGWITEEVARNPRENEDIEDIGKALFMLLEKQAEIEKQYAGK